MLPSPKAFSQARSTELSSQWEKVLAGAPSGPLFQVEFLGSGGLEDCHAWVASLYNQVVDLIHNVVVHRKEHDIRAWRTWCLEERSSHPERSPPADIDREFRIA